MTTPANPVAAIVDIGMGNLHSIEIACKATGIDAVVTADRTVMQKSDLMILPGVGAFEDAMNELRRLDLVSFLQDAAVSDTFLFGICLGMQLLMTSSEEFGLHDGLNILPGRVISFPTETANTSSSFKVPHVGWNRVEIPPGDPANRWNGSPLETLPSPCYQYFVHSLYVAPEDKDVVLSTTTYADVRFCSALGRNRLFACQFHPERSGRHGIAIYKRIRELI